MMLAQIDASTWFQIGLAAGSAIAGIGLGWYLQVRKWFRHRKLNNPLFDIEEPEFTRKHNRIHERLTEARVYARADRAQIVLFHNGGKFLDGNSIKRFSVAHESCSLGIPNEGLVRQNIPLTLLWEKVDILKKNSATIYRTEDLQTEYFRSFKRISNVAAMSILPLRVGSLIVGYISLEWCIGNEENIGSSSMTDFPTMFDHYRSLIETEIQLQERDMD